MNVAENIKTALFESLSPQHLDIVDESALHAGHAGAVPGGETHFNITVVSDSFEGLSRVARQRLVFGLLDKEFKDGLHALSMTTFTSTEYDVV